MSMKKLIFIHGLHTYFAFCSIVAMFTTVFQAENFELVQPSSIFPSSTLTTENPRDWSASLGINKLYSWNSKLRTFYPWTNLLCLSVTWFINTPFFIIIIFFSIETPKNLSGNISRVLQDLEYRTVSQYSNIYTPRNSPKHLKNTCVLLHGQSLQ